MDVLLKVTYTQDFEIIIRDVESVEQAKEAFDPCEDLQGAVAVYGRAVPEDGYPIINCPDCGGKGYHFIEGKDGQGNSSVQCKKCLGNGYLKAVEGTK